MAKLAVTVTVFLCVVTLSQARVALDGFQVDLTENRVNKRDLPVGTSESDPETAVVNTKAIFLPSDKPEDVEVKHAVNEQEPQKTESDSSESKSFRPTTVINFRPINRQFHRRPSLIFRRHPCRHHGLRKPLGQAGRPLLDKREVSYGNDMLTASDVDNSKAEPLRWYRGDWKVKVHHIPARWVNFHDGNGPRFPFRHDDDVAVIEREEEEFKRPRHIFDGHHHHSHHHRHEEEEHEHEGGFLTKIRKFLTHF